MLLFVPLSFIKLPAFSTYITLQTSVFSWESGTRFCLIKKTKVRETSAAVRAHGTREKGREQLWDRLIRRPGSEDVMRTFERHNLTSTGSRQEAWASLCGLKMNWIIPTNGRSGHTLSATNLHLASVKTQSMEHEAQTDVISHGLVQCSESEVHVFVAVNLQRLQLQQRCSEMWNLRY